MRPGFKQVTTTTWKPKTQTTTPNVNYSIIQFKKKGPEPNKLRSIQVLFVAEMGECHSCTQHPILLKTTILYLKKSYMSMVYHQSSYGSIQTTVNNSTINCLPYSNTKWNCNISNNSQMLNNTLVNLMKKWFSGRRNTTGP